MLLYIIRGLFVVMIAAFLYVGINYRQAQTELPENATRLLEMAKEAEEAGNYQLATERYRHALQDKTESMTGQEVLGIFITGMVVAAIVLAVDWLTPKKSLNALAGIFFGLLVGVLLSWAIKPLLIMFNSIFFQMPPDALQMTQWITSICICYLVISMVIQTKDDVRFVIPYVEFARQRKGLRPLVLDTSVIIDGRIYDISQTRLFDNTLVVPRFVLNELQLIADSADKLKRVRGRRGLDMLNKLQTSTIVDVEMDDTPPPGVEARAGVDQKLVAFTKNCDGKLVTNDYNLNKVAQFRGVEVVNINDLANALKAIVVPGEIMEIRINRAGEEAQQGIGYLEDGTMVVVEEGRSRIGELIKLSVTSSLQTSAGRMIFGKYEKTIKKPQPVKQQYRNNNNYNKNNRNKNL